MAWPNFKKRKKNNLCLTFIGHTEQPCSLSEEAIGEHNTKEVRIPGGTPGTWLHGLYCKAFQIILNVIRMQRHYFLFKHNAFVLYIKYFYIIYM